MWVQYLCREVLCPACFFQFYSSSLSVHHYQRERASSLINLKSELVLVPSVDNLPACLFQLFFSSLSLLHYQKERASSIFILYFTLLYNIHSKYCVVKVYLEAVAIQIISFSLTLMYLQTTGCGPSMSHWEKRGDTYTTWVTVVVLSNFTKLAGE